MFGYFGDFDSRAKQRQKLKQEIDQLLESESTTVANIFSLENQEKQDEIMNQMRWGNKKVCQFFDKNRVEELMEYLTSMPPSDSSHERGHKYPFLANQLFVEGGKGVESIVDHFFFTQTKSNSSFTDIKRVSNEDTSKQPNDNSPVKLTNPFKTLGADDQNENKFNPNEDENLDRREGHGNDLQDSPMVEVEQEDDINEDEFHDLDFQINEEADLNPVPLHPVDDGVDQQGVKPGEQEAAPANQESSPASIFQNIQNLVSMLGGSSTEERDQLSELEEIGKDIKHQESILKSDIDTLIESNKSHLTHKQEETEYRSMEMLEKLANPMNTKKSFEMKLVTDDEDDEVFIVHEEGEDDQDNFFVDAGCSPEFANDFKPSQVKEDLEQKPKSLIAQSEINENKNTNSLEQSIGGGAVENPFKNNLFNSEQMPTTSKLQVEINENYIGAPSQPQAVSLGLPESPVVPEMSTHSANIMKRRKQNKGGKKHNISIHQFDEETPDPRLALVGAQPPSSVSQVLVTAVALSNTIQDPSTEPLVTQDIPVQSQTVTTPNEQFQMVALVEDHVQTSSYVPMDKDETVRDQKVDEDDSLNDREEAVVPVQNDELKEPMEVKVVKPEDGHVVGATGNGGLEFQDIEESKEEQESIELIENTEEVEKKQDYRLLDQLFSFLEPNSSGFDKDGLNLTLSGYFCKVVQVLMQKQPKEMTKYIVYTEYEVFNKLMNHLENKSICELFIKMLNELADRNQSLPGIPDMQTVLQQSGQSGDGDAHKPVGTKQPTQADNILQVQQLIIRILDEKITEDTSFMEKMGAFEVIQSLLQKKPFYQTMTSQKAFGVMTKRLVSGDQETMRFMYQIMLELIESYEKHERLEKRINIDLFEDDEMLNEHSGSFHDRKKSTNSKKQNQEVLKDVQESELFHFFTVVIQEVTAQAIEDRFEQLEAADADTRIPLGSYFLNLIQFLEKASATFLGFKYDINHMIIEKELFLYLFDIMEYYRFSDILLSSIFRIIDNILRAKNEDAQEMVRYMIEDTPLIKFLINNKPALVVQDPSAKNNSSGETREVSSLAVEENKEDQPLGEEGNHTKSPEQSKSKSQILQEKSKKEEILQIHQLATTSGIQAYSKGTAGLIHQYYQKDKSTDSKEKSMSKSGGPENSQQSGDQSKSSLVETEEELHAQKVCRIIVAKLKDNEEWRTYATNCIEPILELEKGKLGQESDKKSDKDDSDGNIFDDDFIRSDFGAESNPNYQDQEPTKLSQEEEEDHHKFVQKIQECFSSKLLSGADKKSPTSGDFIDDNERDRKQKQFLSMGPLDEKIRTSLSDLSEEAHFAQRRDRSCSNEGFDLPPLPDLDDNKDLSSGGDLDGILNVNYQSNELTTKNVNFYPDEENDEEGIDDDKDSDNQFIIENVSTQNQAPSSMFEANEGDDLERDDDKLEQDLFKNFENYEADILREMKEALKEEIDDFASGTMPNYTDADLEAEIIVKSKGGSQIKDFDEYNSIFDKMEAEDNDDSLMPALGSDLQTGEIPQTMEDIENDFFGVVIQENGQPQLDDEEQPKEEFNLVLEDVGAHQLAKSVYVPSESKGNDLLTLEEKSAEYQDNQFWDLKHSQTLNYQLDALLEDYE